MTRAAVIGLTLVWLATQLNIGRFSSSYGVYLVMAPWALAFLVVSAMVIAGVDGKRDWFSLTLLAAVAASFVTIGFDRKRWPLDETSGDVSAAWWYLTLEFAPGWTGALGVGMITQVWRWTSASLRGTPLVGRLLTAMAIAIGALAFPMAPAALLALREEEWQGGAGFAVLYPATVVCIAVFVAALRGPMAVAGHALSRSLFVMAGLVVAAVATCSLQILPTARPYPSHSFFSTPLWKLLDVRALGLGFTALAAAWLALAVTARFVETNVRTISLVNRAG